MLTQAELQARMSYDPETGVFSWISGRGRVPGSVAGCRNRDGYRRVSIGGKHYTASRLAWFYVHGKWPERVMDHINGIRDDDRLCNLRDVDISTNNENKRTARSDSSGGYLGVFADGTRFRACIDVRGKRYHLGHFATPAEAHEAYLKAKRIHHQGCTI